MKPCSTGILAVILHDMKLASKHAASIVRSVKQLGGTDNARQPDVDVNDTIHKSLALLQSNLRRVNVVLRPAVLPTMTASTTELVQVWVNIIKNACDAMEDTPEPQIEIITRHSKKPFADHYQQQWADDRRSDTAQGISTQLYDQERWVVVRIRAGSFDCTADRQ